MNVMYREISEQNTVKGVNISCLRVKYPVAEVVGRKDGLFEKMAESFSETVKNGMFKNDAEEFLVYVENGGRRSAFPKRTYSLYITVCGENGNNVSVKTEANVSESVGSFATQTTAYSVDYTVWDRENGLLCDETKLNIKKKRRHDGFFVDENGVRYYDIDKENGLVVDPFTKII